MALERLKTFLFVLVKSLTSLGYYKEVLKTRLHFSIKYYVVLMFLFTLVSSIVLTLQTTPKTQRYAAILLNQLSESWPNNLELRVVNGTFDINQPEPYFIPLPQVLKQDAHENIENLVVFDSEGTINDHQAYQTVILVNKVNILIQSPNKIDVYPLKAFPDQTITKNSVDGFLVQLNTVVRYMGVFIFLAIAGFLLFYNFVVRTIYIVLATGSLYLMSRMQRKTETNTSFAKLYQVSLHTATLPIIVEVFYVALFQTLLPLFWFFMAILVTGNVVLLRFCKVSDEL